MKVKWFLQNEVGGDGGAGAGGAGSTPPADFKASLGDEYRNHAAFADIQDLNGLAKSYLSAQQMIGADKLVIPRDGDAPEKWNEFYQKMGRPESFDKYKLTEPAANEKMQRNPEMEATFKKIFHEAGLTNKQADKVFTEYNKFATDLAMAEMAKSDSERTGWVESLQTEWKNDFEQNGAIANRAAMAFGDDATLTWLNESGLGNHPGLVKMFYKIGMAMGEDKAIGDRAMEMGFASGDQAKTEIARLQGDSEFMKQYMSADDPLHKQAAARMAALYTKAYPGKVQN